MKCTLNKTYLNPTYYTLYFIANIICGELKVDISQFAKCNIQRNLGPWKLNNKSDNYEPGDMSTSADERNCAHHSEKPRNLLQKVPPKKDEENKIWTPKANKI